MKRSASRSEPVNTPFIYFVLIVGFALLLSLIWDIGRFSANRLGELSNRADIRTRDFTSRLRLAIETRAQLETLIAEARFSTSMREEFRIGGPPFEIKLNAAQVELEKLRDECRKTIVLLDNAALRDDFDRRGQQSERAGWQRVEQAITQFLQILQATRRASGKKGQAENTTEAASGAEVEAKPPASMDEAERQDAFYKSRNELSLATRDLVALLLERQETMLKEIKDLQADATAKVNQRRWWTFLVGLGVAFVAYVLTQRQVRQNRVAAQIAQEAEGLTTSVLNSLSNDVLAFDEQGAVLTVNPAFLKDFRLTRAECQLQDYRTLLSHSEELRAFVEWAAQQSDGARLQHQRLELKPDTEQDGTRLFDVDVAPRLVGGEQRGHVVVLTDVTEAERAREEANRNRTLSAVGQLTAQVTHEIYNPLGAIKLNVDLLEMQIGDDPEIKDTVARLKRGLEHLSTIVLDLRYLTRQREPERQPTELNSLLDEVIELAGDRVERSRVVIKRNYAPEKLQGDYDPLQLRKVFLNLLINAVEASPQGGELELRTRPVRPEELGAEFANARGVLKVSVIDHGVGMSAETKRRVFEAFYSTKQHGTGLGMMITQEIIKKHNGRIEIESEEGKGTTVSVYLPV
jgi:PAS domain S-box-containing protein